MLPNYVAGLIRSTSDVVSMAPVCAVVSIIESRGLSLYLHAATCMQGYSIGRWLAHSIAQTFAKERLDYRHTRTQRHACTHTHTHTHSYPQAQSQIHTHSLSLSPPTYTHTHSQTHMQITYLPESSDEG